MRSCHGGKQVRRERRNAALAWQVVADKRDLANFRTVSHEVAFIFLAPSTAMHKSLRANCKCAASVGLGKDSGSVDSVLRAVVFKACGSTDPMRVGWSARRIFAQMQ